MKLQIRSRQLLSDRLGPWGPWEEVETSPETDSRVVEMRAEIDRRAAEFRTDLRRMIATH